MTFDYRKLRGKIVEVFGTQDKLAPVINMSPTTLSNKLKGRYGFTQSEIMKTAEALGIEKEEIHTYFFAQRV